MFSYTKAGSNFGLVVLTTIEHLLREWLSEHTQLLTALRSIAQQEFQLKKAAVPKLSNSRQVSGVNYITDQTDQESGEHQRRGTSWHQADGLYKVKKTGQMTLQSNDLGIAEYSQQIA